jgi:hypothetical protein
MELRELWIANGQLVAAPLEDGRLTQHITDRLHRSGHVRIVAGESGTLVEWCVFAPNWASLQVTREWVRACRGPFKLRYFLAGWFEETCLSAARASERIDQVMAKSDVHLSCRTFVRKCAPRRGRTPQVLYEAWRLGLVSPDYSVDCVFDEQAERFRVERIGARSTIARLWGLAPVSYPCINGGTYDQIVGLAYREVARTGAPRFDHVFAAMTIHEGEPTWIPYQRVILPNWVPSGRPAVTVVTEIAPVDIQIV